MAVLIVDSTCDLSLAQVQELGVTMLSLSVNFGEESYLDKRELTSEAFYQKLAQTQEIPTTSLLNPEDFTKTFNEHPNEEIVVLTLSHKLSGTYQSALIAKEMSGRSDIYLVDTLTVAAAFGLVVQRVAQLAREGMSAHALADAARALAAKTRVLGVLNTLKYLVKGGRLGKVSGYLGGMLNVKPVLTIEDGAVVALTKARGDKEVFATVKDLITQTYPLDPEQPIAFSSASGGEVRLQAFMKSLGLTGEMGAIGSVVGTHAGPGTILIAYFEK